MAYSRTLADRIRHVLRSQRGISDKRMFGGLGFFLHGNMLVVIWQSSLVVRLGLDQAAEALQQEYVGPFEVNGKSIRGWVLVEPDALDSDRQLAAWIDQALAFVETLPPK